jgi:hypothetical protein
MLLPAAGNGPRTMPAEPAVKPATSGCPCDLITQPAKAINGGHIPQIINLHQLVVQKN